MSRIKRSFSKLRDEQRKLRKEIKERTVGYILGAFSLVAALAWNDAIKALITIFFPTAPSNNDLMIKFLYAFIVTIIIVVITVYLIRLTEDKTKEEVKEIKK